MLVHFLGADYSSQVREGILKRSLPISLSRENRWSLGKPRNLKLVGQSTREEGGVGRGKEGRKKERKEIVPAIC